MRRTERTPLLAACCLLAASVVVTAQCPVGKFVASPYSGDQFGRALSVSGGELGVGGWGSASVFILDDNGTPNVAMDDAWLLQTAMYSPNPWDDNYGASVWLEGDHLVVGAPTEGGIFGFGPGAAYIYRRVPNGHSPLDDGWVQLAKLALPDGSVPKGFGGSVCLSGDYAAIGALQDHDPSQTASYGTVRIYRRDDNGTPHEPTDDAWLEQAVVVSADSSYGRFGEVVRLEGKRLLVSAPYGFGALYSFWRDDKGTPDDPVDDAWVEHAKVTSPDAPGQGRFGRALDFDGSLMAVGASSGAYLFRLNDNGTPLDLADDFWTDEATLVPSDARSTTPAYGCAVAVQGDMALVGDQSKQPDPLQPKIGATHVFRNESARVGTLGSRWTEVTTLMPPTMPAKYFGAALRLDGIRAFVGEIGHFAFLPGGAKDWQTGAVWQYAMAVPPWSFQDGALSGSGSPPSLMGAGSLEADALTAISIDNDLADALTALVVGLSALDAPFKGGVLVPQPDAVIWLIADSTGHITASGRWPPGVASGTKLYLQAWTVDPQGPAGLSATNAILGVSP